MKVMNLIWIHHFNRARLLDREQQSASLSPVQLKGFVTSWQQRSKSEKPFLGDAGTEVEVPSTCPRESSIMKRHALTRHQRKQSQNNLALAAPPALLRRWG